MDIKFKDIDEFKELLRNRGISQSELAVLSGCTRSYLNQILNEKKYPKLDLCEKICTSLSLNFDDVFQREDDLEHFCMGDHIDDFPLDFYPSYAKELGLNESIVIQFLNSFIWNYESADMNYLEGYHWFSMKEESWENVFIFWDKATIDETLNNLINKGLIIKNDYLYRVDYHLLHGETHE